MQLKDYFPEIKKEYSKFFFSGIAFESSKIKKNYIFFAIKGNNFDGNDFIPIAIKRGCRIIITEKKTKINSKEFYSFTQKILENYWQRFHLEFIKIDQKI